MTRNDPLIIDWYTRGMPKQISYQAFFDIAIREKFQTYGIAISVFYVHVAGGHLI